MFAIAIDGPGGAGKSTVARAVAKQLGYIYVDTGALYRAIGLYMLQNAILPSDAAAVTQALKQIQISLTFDGGVQKVWLCGLDVSEEIRTPEVSMAASNVSAIPEVRQFLFDLQKKLAEENHVIMDGRDIGTVVLPNAQVKIFLTASPEERAMRRYKELLAKQAPAEYEEVLEDLKQRDYNDSHREIAPLVPAADALQLDSTALTFQETVKKILHAAREAGAPAV